ncbi:hypothetical protein ERO13_D04G163200v2 [Gossypium hirsutum]|uniref:Uncharacterized protein At4g06598 n=1 Tax=Gossypium hirsutum TaxID=3635 RepID=A0ABM2ZWA3_GOSHI|nr:uncharacterized protein At4g06598-like [Gossypium hirsutum]XP_040946903.1 uncharacterized protein At4g06598-like [Gossypium hirsutum]KAG4153100.1 hypothetical protein ERO13_D04G163200v2 [Gossypium hirsutum]
MFAGKHALLPPKSPLPIASPVYTDYIPNNVIGSKVIQKSRVGSTYHQHTSSESHLIEEQPSWLDNLLNEPESPMYKGRHRCSSSDSFAFIDVSNAPNLDYGARDECRYKSMISSPSWTHQDFDHHNQKDARVNSFHANVNLVKQKNRAWDSPSLRESTFIQGLGSSCTLEEPEAPPSTASEKKDSAESASPDAKGSSEKKDNSHTKSSSSDTDSKRAKQQFAQRSRGRKLQYIAELERNVQALQAEGSEVSAELEFLNQQNLILSMENKALKQRLESLAQEQAIKYLEQEVLEREIGRLRVMYQQQNQQQPSSSHQCSSSRDLDSQFANLSLKHNDSSSSLDPITGPVRI